MARITVDNPATGDLVAEVELIGRDGLDDVCRRVAAAARELADSTITERVALCERFLAAFNDGSEQVACDITAQMGKPIAESRAEVGTMVERARYMMSIAEQCLGEIRLDDQPGVARRIEKVPVGVVLDIAAWNYPLLIPVNVVVPAVLAGNAVVLKHSSRTPLCAAHFADAFARAGAPGNLVTALPADHATTAELIGRETVGYVAFTGSVGGGRQVVRAAAARFVDVGLELGGKDAAYVRADADLEIAAEAIAEGGFYNAGQSCCAIERVYAHVRVYDELVERLAAAAGHWRAGDPTAEDTRMGPMAQPAGVVTVARHIEDALSKGARLVVGGATTDVGGRGRYFEATVLAEASHEMDVMTEETFGPLLAVAPVTSDDEAVARMNDCRFGLTASLWTREAQAADALGRRLEAGTVFLNRCDYLDPALPWSGWKDSGVGITLSQFGFDRMVRTRAFNMRASGT